MEANEGVTLASLLLLPDDGLEQDNIIFPEEGDDDNEGDWDWHVAILSAPSDPRFTDSFLALLSSLRCCMW